MKLNLSELFIVVAYLCDEIEVEFPNCLLCTETEVYLEFFKGVAVLCYEIETEFSNCVLCDETEVLFSNRIYLQCVIRMNSASGTESSTVQ